MSASDKTSFFLIFSSKSLSFHRPSRAAPSTVVCACSPFLVATELREKILKRAVAYCKRGVRGLVLGAEVAPSGQRREHLSTGSWGLSITEQSEVAIVVVAGVDVHAIVQGLIENDGRDLMHRSSGTAWARSIRIWGDLRTKVVVTKVELVCKIVRRDAVVEGATIQLQARIGRHSVAGVTAIFAHRRSDGPASSHVVEVEAHIEMLDKVWRWMAKGRGAKGALTGWRRHGVMARR